MSRVFTKNLSNYMSLGVNAIAPLLSGKNKICVSAKVKITSIDTGANNNNVLGTVINATSFGIVLNIDGTGSVAHARISSRSVSTDARQAKTGATAISLGVDTYIGGIVDLATPLITIYTGGAADGTFTPTYANATFTPGTPTGADVIGGFLAPSGSTADQFDGELSEIAIWVSATGDGLSGANFASLAAGTAADSVRNDILVYYLKLTGTTSPEPPTVGTPSGTITGSIPPGGGGAMGAVAEVLSRRRRSTGFN